MTRQYIGARYTPRFVGIFDNTQAYEALDVVDNGQGTSYIARIPVPPNTPLTNTDYWLVYGAASGAILHLQEEIDAINNEINDIKDKLSSDFVTPEDYGAVGDGVTDDTAAMQDMLDAIKTTGGAVLLIGNYRITDKIIIRHNGAVSTEHNPIFIYGGKGSTITIDGGYFAGSSNMDGGVRFIGVYFKGISNSTDVLLSTDDTLRKLHFLECKFENLKSITEITNANLIDDWIFTNCNLFGFGGTIFDINNSSIGLTIENCYLTGDESASNTCAIDLTGTTDNINLMVRNCIFEHFSKAAIILNNKQKLTSIIDSYFEDNACGIDLSPCTVGDNLINVLIEENYFYAETGQYCIKLPLSFATDSSIRNQSRIPVTINNNNLNISGGTGYGFDGTPLMNDGGLYFKIFPAPGSATIEAKLQRYDWRRYELRYTPTGTEGAESPFSIMSSADFISIVGRSDPKEFYFTVERSKNPLLIYRNTDSGNIACYPLTAITSTSDIIINLMYRN